MISEKAIGRVVDRFRLAAPGATNPKSHDVQIVLDASASMASGDGSKEQMSRELSMALLRLASQADRSATLWAARGADRTRNFDSRQSDRLAQFPFDGTAGLIDSWPAEMESCALRIVISDFLFPSNARRVVEQAVQGASITFLVQLLDPWEHAPEPAGRIRLVDIESEEALELTLNSPSIEEYVNRLSSLQREYADACAASGAVWISACTDIELVQICDEQLRPAGLIVMGQSE